LHLVTANVRQRFWAIWQRHRDYLFSQSLRLMNGNRVDAEDALGAAMLRACESFPRHASHIANEKAWLGRVLHNVCVDVYRVRRRYQDTPSLEDAWDESGELLPGAPSPEAALLRGELGSQLRGNILALPPHLREPAVMRFLQDMPYDDIASHLGLTNCNVRKRIQHAYSILRVTLRSRRSTTGAGRGKSSSRRGSPARGGKRRR
jgi:RNA polymerase sigma factor (sigma-70 family)